MEMRKRQLALLFRALSLDWQLVLHLELLLGAGWASAL